MVSIRPINACGCKLLRVALVRNGELAATLATTAGKDLTAVLGSHASTETVGLQTLPLIRLIRALHQNPPGVYKLQ